MTPPPLVHHGTTWGLGVSTLANLHPKPIFLTSGPHMLPQQLSCTPPHRIQPRHQEWRKHPHALSLQPKSAHTPQTYHTPPDQHPLIVRCAINRKSEEMSSSLEEGSAGGGRETTNSNNDPKSTAKQVFADYEDSEAAGMRKVGFQPRKSANRRSCKFYFNAENLVL